MLPTPDFSVMEDWAKLRLIKGAQDNNVSIAKGLNENHISLAIDETLHLGRLIHSTETLSGALVCLAIQEVVWKFSQLNKKLLRFDAKVFNKGRIYFPALAKALGQPFTEGRAYLKLLQINSGPGYCAAGNYAANILLMYKSTLENDFKSIYIGFGNLLKSSTKCRWQLIRKAWAGDPRYPVQFAALNNLGLKARKKETDSLKSSISADEYQLLAGEISNPRWPQFYVYLLAMKINPAQLFSGL
jgi:hypothetical protein